MLALLVAKVMAVSGLAGTLLLCALGIAGLCLTARLIGPAKGEHAVPRGYAEADERLADTSERVIPRAITEHDAPWGRAPFTSLMRAPEPESEPAFQAAPVIEPAAITSGPPDDTEVIITATLSIQYPPGSPPWVDEKIRTGMGVALLPPVAELLGYPSTDAAVDALAAPWHSVDSIFNGADVRQVRARLEAGS